MNKDILTEAAIRAALPEKYRDLQIFVYDTTDSTNTRAEIFAREGGTEAVFVAREQTAGRGRRGRSFVSGRDLGLYISFLLGRRPDASAALSLTSYSAVALSRTVERLFGARPSIKWVNDIYLGERKLAGILTTGQVSEDGRGLDFAVVGIGINILGRDFPREIRDIATSLEREGYGGVSLPDFAAAFINEFYSSLHLVGEREITEEYRSRQMLTGRRVTVERAGESFTAEVLGVSDSCALRLRLDGGEEIFLSTGEVSVHTVKD